MGSNVFKELDCKNPEQMHVRAGLLSDVILEIKKTKMPQKEVAHRLGISQPKVSDLLNGKIDKFSSDSLLSYLDRLGCLVKIMVKSPIRKAKTRSDASTISLQ